MAYRRDRTNLEDCTGLDCCNSNGIFQFSAQKYRHEGSGPRVATTYAGNGSDVAKWENVGVGDTERQIGAGSRGTHTGGLQRTPGSHGSAHRSTTGTHLCGAESG
eukprot:15163355-Heterocapsa_arctica.AAC.1